MRLVVPRAEELLRTAANAAAAGKLARDDVVKRAARVVRRRARRVERVEVGVAEGVVELAAALARFPGRVAEGAAARELVDLVGEARGEGLLGFQRVVSGSQRVDGPREDEILVLLEWERERGFLTQIASSLCGFSAEEFRELTFYARR